MSESNIRITKHPKTRGNEQEQQSALRAACFVLPSFLGILDFGPPSCPGLSGVEPSLAFISPGGSEFLLIMLVLILLFGAKDAPRIFRTIQTTLDKIQRAAASFRYKIMYSDLHQGTAGEEPYDVESAVPDDEDDLHWVDDAEPEPEEQTAENPEDETEDAESKT